MIFLKCKMCGSALQPEGKSADCICRCADCGTLQTIPVPGDENKILLFNRANRLRRVGEFGKASEIYTDIVREFPKEAEGYWGQVLCRFCITYADDPETGGKVPQIGNASAGSIYTDPDYDRTIEYAVLSSGSQYRAEAMQIEMLRAGKGGSAEEQEADTVGGGQAGSSDLVQHGYQALANGRMMKARDVFGSALLSNPNDPLACLGGFLASHGLRSIDELGAKACDDLSRDEGWASAERCADADLAQMLASVKIKCMWNYQLLRLTAVLEEKLRNENAEKADNLLRDIYRILLDGDKTQPNTVNGKLAELKQIGGAYEERADRLKHRKSMINSLGKLLSDNEYHDERDIRFFIVDKSTGQFTSADLREELPEMVRVGVVAQKNTKYCLSGATEIMEERRKKARRDQKIIEEVHKENRQEKQRVTAYRQACARTEELIQKKIAERKAEIEKQYEIKAGATEKEMMRRINESNKQRDILLREYQAKQRMCEGFTIFQSKEKQKMESEVAALKIRISQYNEQAIRRDYRKNFEYLETCKRNDLRTMEKEVREKYKLPPLSEWHAQR